MTLGNVRAGDIVRVDKKGRLFLAEVAERLTEGDKKTRLKIQPLVKGITYFEANANEVKAHWRKVGR